MEEDGGAPDLSRPAGTQCLFAARRKRFLERLGPHDAALLVANPERTRSADTNFTYRQNSDLWYLTGFEEPGAAALFLPGHEEHVFVLFLRPRDKAVEIWDGPRVGVERAPEQVGADAAFPIEELDARLGKLLAGRGRLHYALGHAEAMDRKVIRAYRAAQRLARGRSRCPRSIVEPTELLHEMRLVKSPEEIERIRHACRVTAEAHVHGMRHTRPGMGEWELQAEIEYVFAGRGARAPGYSSIVGSGANGCVLHYIDNRDVMEEGSLVLVDAGAEVDYYTGDVTRTWPVSGGFDEAQRRIYDLVLEAQTAAIRLIRPGLPWHRLHETTVRIITEGLIALGVLEGPLDEAIKEKTYRKWYMHGTGHWLGLDVHDVGVYAREGEPGRPLEPGMVFTVEPGIYFHPDAEACPDEYRGIGVRIEDNVLVTEEGSEVLTAFAPKNPDDIEAIVGADVEV